MTEDGGFLAYLRSVPEQIDEYCEGKSPWWRAAVAVFLAYIGVRYMADDFYVSLFDGLTLGVHEAGHIVCRSLGRTMYILGGSLMQLAVPAFCAAYLLLRQRDWFGLSFGLSWLSFSGWNLATYIADANKENLPLATLSPNKPDHDWATLLTQWHLLNSCEAIASGVRVAAFSVWVLSMALAAWVVFRIVRLR